MDKSKKYTKVQGRQCFVCRSAIFPKHRKASFMHWSEQRNFQTWLCHFSFFNPLATAHKSSELLSQVLQSVLLPTLLSLRSALLLFLWLKSHFLSMSSKFFSLIFRNSTLWIQPVMAWKVSDLYFPSCLFPIGVGHKKDSRSFGGQKGSSHFVTHTQFGPCADSPHWHQAATKPAAFLHYLGSSLQLLQLQSQVFVFSSRTQGPTFCRVTLTPRSEVTRTDTNFSLSLQNSISCLWFPAFSQSPLLCIHYPFPTACTMASSSNIGHGDNSSQTLLNQLTRLQKIPQNHRQTDKTHLLMVLFLCQGHPCPHLPRFTLHGPPLLSIPSSSINSQPLMARRDTSLHTHTHAAVQPKQTVWNPQSVWLILPFILGISVHANFPLLMTRLYILQGQEPCVTRFQVS